MTKTMYIYEQTDEMWNSKYTCYVKQRKLAGFSIRIFYGEHWEDK